MSDEVVGENGILSGVCDVDLKFWRRRLMCPYAVSIEWGLLAAIIEADRRGKFPSQPLLAALSKEESHGLKKQLAM